MGVEWATVEEVEALPDAWVDDIQEPGRDFCSTADSDLRFEKWAKRQNKRWRRQFAIEYPGLCIDEELKRSKPRLKKAGPIQMVQCCDCAGWTPHVWAQKCAACLAREQQEQYARRRDYDAGATARRLAADESRRVAAARGVRVRLSTGEWLGPVGGE